MPHISTIAVSIDAQWVRSVRLPNGAALEPRPLRRENVPAPASPSQPSVLPWDPAEIVETVDVRRMADRFRRIAQRKPASNHASADFDVVEAGRYLFRTLFSTHEWQAIVASVEANTDVIELALEWPSDQHHLHRLNWEIMHGPAGFLAAHFAGAGGLKRVTVTRVVGGAAPEVRPPAAHPRILFIVGCSLYDSRIRAGSELLGFLLQTKAKDRKGTMTTERFWPVRIVLDATPSRIMAAMEDFQPDVVHFVTHGMADAGSPPCLLLQPDKKEDGDQWKDASQLVSLLTVNAPKTPGHGWRPRLVILSACFSGTVGGPSEGGPLAAQLVAAGIPMVVGMAGEIADQACRLFLRTFGDAFVQGLPLTLGMEWARRMAFTLGDWPKQSVDWGLPALYRSSAVPPEYAFASGNLSPAENWLRNALVGLEIERKGDPVLAARIELLDAHYERVLRGDPGTLFVIGGPGSGKSRLLRELTAQALAAGHLPLLITADEKVDRERFRDSDSIRALWVAALGRMCQALRLPFPPQTQLEALGTNAPPSPHLHPDVATSVRLAPGTLQPLLRALRVDLQALLATARNVAPERHPPQARAWLLLDHLHLYPPHLQPGFFDSHLKSFTSFGLSDDGDHILPVVLAFNSEADSAQALKPVVDGNCRRWSVDLLLDCFPADGTDLRCYNRVLLNPHKPALGKPVLDAVAARGWRFNYDLEFSEKKKWDEWIGRLRLWVQRQPRDFVEEDLYRWVETAQGLGVVIEADDEARLREVPI